jgi:hypothetical protein
MWSWRLMRRLSGLALLVGSFAGCGGVSAPNGPTPPHAVALPGAQSSQPFSQAAPARSNNACYPGWERRDLVQVVQTPTASPAVTITADLGNGPRLTAASLPVWFGQSSKLSDPTAGLLQGWQLGTTQATRGNAELRLVTTAGDGPVSFGSPELELVYAIPHSLPGGATAASGNPDRGPADLARPDSSGQPQDLSVLRGGRARQAGRPGRIQRGAYGRGRIEFGLTGARLADLRRPI